MINDFLLIINDFRTSQNDFRTCNNDFETSENKKTRLKFRAFYGIEEKNSVLINILLKKLSIQIGNVFFYLFYFKLFFCYFNFKFAALYRR